MVLRRFLAYLVEGLYWVGVAHGTTLLPPEEDPEEGTVTELWWTRQTRPHR